MATGNVVLQCCALSTKWPAVQAVVTRPTGTNPGTTMGSSITSSVQ